MRHFVVDEFACQSQAYFLTHLHSDHTSGLSAQWCRGLLYCSKVTAILLLAKFKGFDRSLLRILELGSPTLITQNRGSSKTLLEVTAIDASHCPGAVMYVFHGEFGCIVHTGDFRWNNDGCSLGEREMQLKKALGGIEVDWLYIDNTFCNPMFSFPPRNTAASRIIELIGNYPGHDIVIGIDNLGKEELLLCIAEALKTKICVWPQRLKTMHLLGFRKVFTTDTTVTRIRAVPRYSFSVQCLKMLNEIRPTIGILPSGFCLCNPVGSQYGKSSKKSCSEKCYNALTAPDPQQELCQDADRVISPFIHVIPYSLHCCFSEIRNFFELIRPKVVIGIVKSPPKYSINPAEHLHQYTNPSSRTTVSEEHSSLKLVTHPDLDFPESLERLKTRCKRTFSIRYTKRRRLQGKGAKLCSSSIDISGS